MYRGSMENTKINRSLLFGCMGLLFAPSGLMEAASEEHPNLLVVMADQFRGDALGFRGKEAVKTPNLDQFAQEAVVLTQAVSGYPVSSPARGMFLSGAAREWSIDELSVGISASGCGTAPGSDLLVGCIGTGWLCNGIHREMAFG